MNVRSTFVFKEDTPVTLEVNEAGTVIDVHRATDGAVKP